MMRLALLAAALWLATALAGHAAGLRVYENVPLATMPADLFGARQDHLLELGYLDVTRPPYFADPTGARDSRAAVQRAIDDAYANNLVAYFPKGTYLFSGGLRAIQRPMPDAEGVGQRKYAVAIMGDGSGGTFPTLRLMDNRTNLQDGTFIYIAYEGAPAPETRHYNSLIRGFNINMGNNPRATALSMNGAQWCTIQDIRITGNFDVGIHNLPGSGGSSTNVRITGGRIGIRQDNYRPSPSVQGLTLTNQREAGIELINTRGPLILAGFRISGRSSGYRAIRMPQATSPTHPNANLVLADGTIELTDAAQVAIEGEDQNLYIRNTYIKAPILVRNGKLRSPPEELRGEAGRWHLLEEYAFASGRSGSRLTVDGIDVGGTGANDKELPARIRPVATPRQFFSKHSWSAANFPTFFNTAWVDVRSYGATPDNPADDDAPNINAALRDSVTPGHRHFGKAVFLPRGHYHVRQPVEVPLGAKLIGASNTISVIDAAPEWRPAGPTALLRTADGPGTVILADFAVHGHEPSAARGLTAHRHIVLFHGRSSDLWLRDVQINRREYWRNGRGHYDQPVVLFSGNAGGRVYNLALDLWHGPAEQMARGHRMLKIDGTRRRLRIYQPNVEGTENNPQAEIVDARHVAFYGFKFEQENELLHITRSSNIAILGGSGNYDLNAGEPAIITITDSTDVLLANLARQGRDGDYAWVRDGEIAVPANIRNLTLYRTGNPQP